MGRAAWRVLHERRHEFERCISASLISRYKNKTYGKYQKSQDTMYLKTFIALSTLLVAQTANAQKKYDIGATDTEIKIGNTAAYSGANSPGSTTVKTAAAYFKMINDMGGINGRKINFISYDDASTPSKTIEQARKLVESDEVLALFSTIGTASTLAVRKYLNTKGVPQIISASGASSLGDPKNFPWTMGLMPSYRNEGQVYAKYILDELPNGKVAVLYQNDDLGKDLLIGLKEGLGNKISMVVAEAAYDTSQPTVDSEVAQLRASGADIFVIFSTPKFAAQAIRRSAEMGWTATRLLDSIATSASTTSTAGLENSKGVISVDYRKDVLDPRLQNDPGVKEWSEFMDKHMPANADRNDNTYVIGYLYAAALVQILKQCGDDLTRENVMRQTANLKNFEIGVLIDGIKLDTSPTDFYPIEQFQFRRFDDGKWLPFGPVVNTGISHR